MSEDGGYEYWGGYEFGEIILLELLIKFPHFERSCQCEAIQPISKRFTLQLSPIKGWAFSAKYTPLCKGKGVVYWR